MSPATAARRLGYLEYVASPQAAMPALIVIAGKEHLLADDLLRQIVQSVLPDESLRPLNVDTIDAAVTSDFSALSEKLAALPFLAERRVVTVRGAAALHNDDRIALRDAIFDIPEQALLVIDDSGEGRPQRGKAPKDKVDSAHFAARHPRSLVIDTTLSEPDRERYIERYAAAIGVAVETGARRYLAGFESVDEIRNSLDRLALVARKITKAAAEEYVKPPGDPKLWDLGNAVARGDVGAALRAAHDIVTRPEDAAGPLIWLAGDAQIAWELASGANPNGWAAATGQSPFRAIKLWDFARKRTPQQAKDNVRLTMRVLEDSLTGKRAGDQALDELIIRFCTQKL